MRGEEFVDPVGKSARLREGIRDAEGGHRVLLDRLDGGIGADAPQCGNEGLAVMGELDASGIRQILSLPGYRKLNQRKDGVS